MGVAMEAAPVSRRADSRTTLNPKIVQMLDMAARADRPPYIC
ncbi:hypothetical protein [Burkholderia sp. WAC0059]|nr:hypothetical protein [Burkholderia sp. WAC0059]